CVALLLAVARLRAAWFGVAAAALAVLGLLAVVVVAHAARVTLPPTMPLAAIAMTAGGVALVRRAALRRELGRLRTWANQQAHRPGTLPASAFGQPFVELSRTVIGAHSAVFAELPAGAFHLVVRATDGVTAADIAEPRRDVRREPY